MRSSDEIEQDQMKYFYINIYYLIHNTKEDSASKLCVPQTILGKLACKNYAFIQ